jgi:hypothetical protein
MNGSPVASISGSFDGNEHSPAGPGLKATGGEPCPLARCSGISRTASDWPWRLLHQLLQWNRDRFPAELSARVGSSDHSQFSHHFKRLVGVTRGSAEGPQELPDR